MIYMLWLISVFVISCSSAPTEPTRIDLPVYNSPEEAHLTEPFEVENHPGLNYKKEEPLSNGIIAQKINAASSLFGYKKNLSPEGGKNIGGVVSLFSPPVTTREGAVLETEGLGSKVLSVKDNIHQAVAGLLQPKPIVDTITEDEKYGNEGEKYYNTGKVLVGGAESISNLANTILEIPGTIIKKITRTATEKLNNLGGRLIGLY